MIFNFIDGEVLLFNKPFLWTSFDLVGRVRYLLKKQLHVKDIKVGHAGTLDPMATGLVIICTGKATKKINEFQDREKEYIATIKIGATTRSFDLETPVDHEFDCSHITHEMIEEKLKGFMGLQDQVPPVFSAKMVDGKRAYKYARKGEDIELKPKRINISEISILNFDLPILKIRVKCSKGTYIRALARDIGLALGSGAYLIALQRTAIGEFKIDEAFNIENFKNIIEKL